MPTIHVSDLARCVLFLADNAVSKQYLVAVDKCEKRSQKEIMLAISGSLGSGALKSVSLA